MCCPQSTQDRHRTTRYQIPIFILIVLLANLLAGQTAKAQTRRFTATPLFPDTAITATKEAMVHPNQETPPGPESSILVQKSPPRAILAPGVCDSTIAAGTSPAGYLALSLFGVAPVAGVTDDSVTNFTVPAFNYGGDTYTRVGFASNGYVIVGGSTVPADNTSTNQNLPNPTLPNNVLAPFWTNLNPASAGALRIAVLTDGLDTWIVLDWAGVREFSTANSNSFEVWIGINGDTNPGEDISFAYGTIQGSGDLGLLTVGAENKFGTHGQNTYFNGTGTLPSSDVDWRVSTTSCFDIPTLSEVGLLALMLCLVVGAWSQLRRRKTA
jgi:hypothetical protein